LEEFLVNTATKLGGVETKIGIEELRFLGQRNIFAFHHALIRGFGSIILANDFVANAFFGNEFEDGLEEVDIQAQILVDAD